MSDLLRLEHSLRQGLGVSGLESSPTALEVLAMRLGDPQGPSLQATIAQSSKDIVKALGGVERAIRGEAPVNVRTGGPEFCDWVEDTVEELMERYAKAGTPLKGGFPITKALREAYQKGKESAT